MITLKLATYKTEEIISLFILLDQANDTLHEICLYPQTCETCGVRHLCGDLHRALTYAKNAAAEAAKEANPE